jgi:hypothetical protein
MVTGSVYRRGALEKNIPFTYSRVRHFRC